VSRIAVALYIACDNVASFSNWNGFISVGSCVVFISIAKITGSVGSTAIGKA
jgi:hypothetical protein